MYHSLLVANPYPELPTVKLEVAHKPARTVLHEYADHVYQFR
jgi:hypothetical protein